jgi:hypothetical protein
MVDKVKTKADGAGGALTTTHGFNYEELTNFTNFIKYDNKIIFGKGKNDFYEEYKIDDIIYLRMVKNGLKQYLKLVRNQLCEKYLLPDECFICQATKTIFILEKKFQQCSGSVDEKIQTAIFKYEYYMEQYPTYTIKYAYVLSDWFKKKCYRPEMRFLAKYKISVFWGSDSNYVSLIKKWLH